MTENAPQYVRLTEHNEWEGETWHRYLPLQGNQDALRQLGLFLGEVEGEDAEWFSLSEETLTETQVDTLVEYGNDENCSYAEQHKKLRGRLNVENLTEVGQLTKGQITDFLFDGAPGDPWPEKPISQ